jgi:hypothetical protein
MRVRLVDVVVAILSAAAILHCESPVKNDVGPQIRLIAFAERSAQGKSGPILLQVYIGILNELDSINIPQGLPHGGETVHDSDLTHIDFGVSGSGTFIQVAPGECVKTTLLLREEQFALLERVKQMKAAVKFRDGGDQAGEVTTVLLPATVYKINP